MKRLLILISFLLIIASASGALAHPLNTKLWGHRLTATARPDLLQIDYTIEVPVTKLALLMSRYRQINKLKRLGPKEEAAFNTDMIEHLIKGIHVFIDGHEIATKWNPNYAKQHGHGDAGFFEYNLHLIAPIEILAGKSVDEMLRVVNVEISNNNFPMQKAVFFNEASERPGVWISNSSINVDAGWQKGEKFRVIAFKIVEGTRPAGTVFLGATPDSQNDAKIGNSLLSMLKTRELTPGVLWIAFMSAIFLGALHALSPGHGKALVAAYLVGTRGTIKDAIWLGLIVTITHISSVVILGIVGLILAEYIVPEYYTPFISLFSGAIIVGIGIWLFVRRLISHGHHHHHHHAEQTEPPSRKQLLLMGISGGIVPCPSATVVMLTALAIGRVALGLGLIAFFSIGLAVVLTVIGILTVRASSLIKRVPKSDVLMRWLPLVSAAIVTILGLAIIYRGFWLEWLMLR
jgi:nickel/cobalt transporter (NicO) family protein